MVRLYEFLTRKDKNKITRFQIYKKIVDKSTTCCIGIPVRYAIFYGIATSISSITVLISAYLYRIFVDDIITNGRLEILIYVIVSMISVFIIKLVCSFVAARYLMKFNNEVNLGVKKRIFSIIIGKDITVHSKSDIGNYQKLIETESASISEFFIEQIVGREVSIVFLIVYFIILLIINPFLTFLILIFIPITYFFGECIGKKFNVCNNNLREIEATNNNYLFDTLQKWREIKANTLEDSMVEKYRNRLEPEKCINIKWMKYHALEKLYYSVKNEFIQKLLLFCIGGLFIVLKKITIGRLVMFISLTTSLCTELDSIISLSTKFTSNLAVYKRVFDIIDSNTEQRKQKQHSIKSFDMELLNLDFSYLDSLPEVIKLKKIKFEYGKKYLIVGKSGEGKSTLVKLILRMYKPINENGDFAFMIASEAFATISRKKISFSE